MNPIIQANARCIRQKDIPELMELYHFIQKLDRKYGVNSSDTRNSFGIIQPERMLISELYEANLYFYLFGYRSEVTGIPKYAYQLINSQAGILYSHMSKPIALKIEEKDKQQLIHLRQKAKAAANLVFPKKPVFSDTQNASYSDYDQQLEEQGFASSKHAFSTSVFVPAKDGHTHPFTVEFNRQKPNKKPHFSTTYHGWQNQKDMIETELAYQFYCKWDPFHSIELTLEEWIELTQDVNELKAHYTRRKKK